MMPGNVPIHLGQQLCTRYVKTLSVKIKSSYAGFLFMNRRMGTCWWALVSIVIQVWIFTKLRQTGSLFEKIAHFDVGQLSTIMTF